MTSGKTDARLRKVVLVVAVIVLFVSAAGWWHARSFCRFMGKGERTPTPEKLSFADKARILVTGVRVPRPVYDRTPSDLQLLYEKVAIPAERSGEQRLAGWRIPLKGARGIVLLFHGYARCASQNLSAARIFREMGFEVYLVDFRGCGESEGRESSLGYDEGDDVIRSYQAVSSGLPVILFGESMGSAAILRAMTTGVMSPVAVILEHPFDSLLHAVEARFRVMGLPAEPGAFLLVFWGGVRQGFNGLSFSPAHDALSVHCPALVIRGAQDPMVSREETERVFRGLAGRKEFLEVPGVGHLPIAETSPEIWKSAVDAFLRTALVGR